MWLYCVMFIYELFSKRKGSLLHFWKNSFFALFPAVTQVSGFFQVNIHGTQRHPETPVNIAGFHLPHKVKKKNLVWFIKTSFSYWKSSITNYFHKFKKNVSLWCPFSNQVIIKSAKSIALRQIPQIPKTVTSSTPFSSGESRCHQSVTTCWSSL